MLSNRRSRAWGAENARSLSRSHKFSGNDYGSCVGHRISRQTRLHWSHSCTDWRPKSLQTKNRVRNQTFGLILERRQSGFISCQTQKRWGCGPCTVQTDSERLPNELWSGQAHFKLLIMTDEKKQSYCPVKTQLIVLDGLISVRLDRNRDDRWSPVN